MEVLSPERWRRMQALFEAATGVPPGPARTALLARECPDDATLRDEVLAMLAAHERGSDLGAQVSAAVFDFGQGPVEMPIRSAGPYRLTRELGRGGLGIVYLGERDDGQYAAQVAVKVLRAGLDTQFFLSRFELEGRALARLEHPNIARIYDTGTTEDGLTYLVMEWVRGEPITAYAGRRQLNVERTLGLFLEVCDAVSHAHRQSIVHRDLKPANILVQADGRPKLLDFGISKLMTEAPPAEATLAGVPVMAAEYASPEQVRNLPVSEASDIYSLAAVCYELLTGRKPHVVDPQRPAAQLTLYEEEIRPPSEVAMDRSRVPLLQGLLDRTLLKALAAQPAHRYQTVDDFRQDLARVLNREQDLVDEAFIRGVPPEIPRWVGIALGAVVIAAAVEWQGWLRLHDDSRRVDAAIMPSYLEAHHLLKGDTVSVPFEESAAKARRALQMFEHAAQTHPQSARLQSGIADAHVELADLEPAKFYEHMQAVQEAARRGLALDDRLEELHHSLGEALLWGSWQLSEAMASFDRAVRINPRRSSSQRRRADIFCMLGRFPEALAALESALALSPLDTEVGGEKALVYFRWRKLAEAEQAARQALAVNANEPMAMFALGLVHQYEGRPAAAEALFRKLPPRPGRYPLALAHLLFTTGRAAEAEAPFALVSRFHSNPSARALVVAARGDKESALDLMEQAYRERDINLLYVPMDPRYDILRAEPRFVKLFNRIGLPPAP